MRHLVFTGLGAGFVLMGAALYALTLRKPKSQPKALNPTKTQLREQSALAEETKKMRIAAACIACFGAVLVILSFI